MTLITWINLLQYLRLYEFFRFFIDLVKAVFLSADTWKFFIVMVILLMAFSSSMFLLSYKKAISWELYNTSENSSGNPYLPEGKTEVDKSLLLPLFKDFVYTSFGDFSQSSGLTDDWMQYFIFAFAVLLMCLIMLNLLIGILSEAMNETLATKTQSDYAALCGIIFDLETIMFWVPLQANLRTNQAEEKKKEF
jgi:hypothetical protein